MYALEMSGSVGTDPAKPTEASALIQAIDLAFKAVYDGVIGGGLTIACPDLSPYTPALGSITKVKALALRAVDGQSLVLKVTSTNGGADQALPVSDLALLRTQNSGDELSA